MRTLIVGVGNPIASEDMFGILVAEKLEKILSNYKEVEIDYCVESGVRLAEKIIGYDKVIIIDAIKADNGEASEIKMMNIKEWSNKAFKTPFTPHDIDFMTAIKIMREAFKSEFPKEIIILGYFLPKELEISDKIPKDFLDKVDEAVKIILDMVKMR